MPHLLRGFGRGNLIFAEFARADVGMAHLLYIKRRHPLFPPLCGILIHAAALIHITFRPCRTIRTYAHCRRGPLRARRSAKSTANCEKTFYSRVRSGRKHRIPMRPRHTGAMRPRNGRHRGPSMQRHSAAPGRNPGLYSRRARHTDFSKPCGRSGVMPGSGRRGILP